MARDINVHGSRNKRVNASKEIRLKKAIKSYAKNTASKMGALPKPKSEPVNYKTTSRKYKKLRPKRKY